VLGTILGLKIGEIERRMRKFIMRNFIVCILQQNMISVDSVSEWVELIQHIWDMKNAHRF
jgi:hypothetical protein